MHTRLKLVIYSSGLLVLACQSHPEGSPRSLELISQRLISPPASSGVPFEPSGLTYLDGRMVVVSDSPSFTALYQLDDSSGLDLHASPFLTLEGPVPGDGDFEGLDWDGTKIRLVEEDSQSVGVVELDGSVTWTHIDLDQVHAGASTPYGTPNAGFEGIASAPEHGIVYVALERQYRTIYELDAGTLRPLGFFDVPAGNSLPRWERREDGGWTSVMPDYTGLCFTGGFLYALVRNDSTILKIDPKARALVERVSLGLDPRDLYATDEPFGLAEGLLVRGERVYVLLDNNSFPRKGHPEDARSTLLEFRRPPGF